MQGHAPTGNAEIDSLLDEALRTGADGDADALLESIRIGFAVFDYMNTVEGTVRWNNVRNNVSGFRTVMRLWLVEPWHHAGEGRA